MWHASLERLREYRTRGLLGAAGVAVGAACIVFLTSLVSSVAADSTSGLNRLGQNRIFVSPPVPKPGTAVRPPVLTLDDAVYLRRRVPEIEAATPVVALTATLNVCSTRELVRVMAVGPEHLALERQEVVAGRYIGSLDVGRRASVIAVGYALWRRNPCLSQLGSDVQIGTQLYQVVGLLGPRGFRLGESQDESIHMPFTTAEHRYIRSGTPVSIMLTVREGSSVRATAAMVRRLLASRSRLGTEQAIVSTQTDLLGEMARVERDAIVLTVLLLIVALLIAGIGVMNAVMTSVVERTSEIGLRRAVGAKRRHIAFQFLLESVAITTGGTVCGVVLGACGAVFASVLLRAPATLDIRSVVFAILASAFLGIICGLWPAIKAARLAPVDALRHE